MQRGGHHRVGQRPRELVSGARSRAASPNRGTSASSPRRRAGLPSVFATSSDITCGGSGLSPTTRRISVSVSAGDSWLTCSTVRLSALGHGDAKPGRDVSRSSSRLARQLAMTRAEELERRRVDPVQVLDDEQRRASAGARGEQRHAARRPSSASASADAVRAAGSRLRAGCRRAARAAAARYPSRSRAPQDPRAAARAARAGAWSSANPVPRAQRRDHRVERGAAVVRRAIALEDLARACADPFAEDRKQPRLADAGLALQQHAVPRAVARGEPRLRQRRDRALASDVRREPLRATRLRAGGGRRSPPRRGTPRSARPVP